MKILDLSSVGAGRQEQSRQYWNWLAETKSGESMNCLPRRSQPFNELAAILGRTNGDYSPTISEGNAISNIGAPDLTSTYNNNYAQQNQANMQQQAGMMEGLGTLFSKGMF